MVRNKILFLLVHLHLKLLCLNIQLQAVSMADPGLGRERQEDVELEPILSILQAQHKKILPKNERQKQSTMDFHFLIPKCPSMIRRNKSTVRHRNSTFESLCPWPCGWIVTVRKERSTGCTQMRTCLSQRWLERRKW